jgi:hypothetical protein
MHLEPKRYGIALLLVLVGGPNVATQVAADDQAIPADLRITAEYKAGYSHWLSWDVTISGDGNATQEYFSQDAEDVKKRLVLSRADVQELLKEIEEAKFFGLRKRYEYAVTDNPSLTIKVVMNKSSHEVEVYAPDYLKKEKVVKAFLRVWSRILRKVPSPNKEQTPDYYRD